MIADPKRKPRQDGDRAPRECRVRAFDEVLQNTFLASEPVSAAQPAADGQGPALRSFAIPAGRSPDDRPKQGYRVGGG